MAIKVIDDSKVIKPNAKYEVTCASCNAVVQYLGQDVSYHRNFPQGYVYCPNCQRPIPHNEDNRCGTDASPEEMKETEKDTLSSSQIAIIIISVVLLILIIGITLLVLFLTGVIK